MLRPATVLALVAASLAAAAAAAPARLLFTRADGSAIRFHGTPRVWCGPWAPDVATPALHVWSTTTVQPPGKAGGWKFDVARRDLQRGRRRFAFPNDFPSDRPHGALLFVYDPPNEASSAGEDSSGAMRFTRATCRRGGVVAFRIRAVVDSELFDGPPIRVRGTWRGRVAAPPTFPHG
jgi:hypothetical protein